MTDTGRRPDRRSARLAAREAPGRATGAGAGQHGIVGMRERATVFGGTLDAGPVPGRRVPGGGVPARSGQPATGRAAGAGVSGGMTIGVVVADDQATVRAGFRLLIESEPDLVVLGEAANGAEAVAVASRTAPDVVLMDIRMPVLDGIEATRRITAAGPPPRVLILTTFDLDEYVFGALRAGASGFMLKERPPEELLAAIRVVAAGEALLAPNITHRLIAHFARQPDPLRPPPEALAQLTAREREVLVLIAHGLSNTEIAGRLSMSVPTAKTHVSRILAKLGARDRAQLVVLAYQARPGPGLRQRGRTSRSSAMAGLTPQAAGNSVRQADDAAAARPPWDALSSLPVELHEIAVDVAREGWHRILIVVGLLVVRRCAGFAARFRWLVVSGWSSWR